MPPPDRDTIAGPIPEEREWVEHQFAGKRWDEVVFTEGETYDTLSVLLSETAFPYYFVSLLYQTLLQSGECLAVYEVQSALGFDEGWQKRFYASIAALEQDQILALAQAVRCIADLTPGPIGYGSPEDHEGLVKMSKRIREMAEKP
ncbi:MAG: hypothetical protein EON58_02535 [Alphaproteobacteria bacterium]|nr:MAG: hypothetical protein EON58_02535 [Alphaproteobacteria bacterium]